MPAMKGYIGVYEFARRTGRDVTALYKLLLTGRIEGATKTPAGRWQIPEDQVKPYTKAKDGEAA